MIIMQNPIKFVKPFIAKHEPEILMGMGISGLIFSTAWAIRATIKATKAIENYKDNKNIDKITFKEGFKLTWKYYWPVAASITVSIPCIIAGNRVSSRKYAALAAAYTISETALQEYQDKTREIVGEKKAKQIQESVDGDRIEKSYKDSNQIIMIGKGENLFFEPLSGRYFKSSWNDLYAAANELNATAIGSMSGEIRLNEWYDKIGLEPTDMGDEIGWALNGNPKELIKINLSSHLTNDKTPCAAISYERNPIKL